MEAMGDNAADHTAGRTVTSGFSAVSLLRSRQLRSVPASMPHDGRVDRMVSDGGASVSLQACLALAEAAVESAPKELGMAGFGEAADFADLAEELSRRVEHLQLLAAAAVERTRTAAINTAAINTAGPVSKAAGWTTGWGAEPGTEPAAAASALPSAAAVPGAVDPADDGCRNAAEFLRIRLRISIGEARRRLALACSVLPRTGIGGTPLPPACEHTATVLAAGTIASRAGTIITTALDKARPIAQPAVLDHMETILVRTAIENDHDFLARIAHRWTDAIDQDGTEPTEEELRHRQGAFLRRPRRGLHHLEIFATTDQYEHLLTVMNTATNPRTGTNAQTSPREASGNDGTADRYAEPGVHTGPGFGDAAETAANDAHLERRTRPQQLLDGLVGACKTALATNTLPATGGLRPQVMVTINHQDLLNRLETAATNGPRYPHTTPTNQPTDSRAATGPGTGTGTFTFTGPVTAATIRKIACDADIIPILLGTEGRILDIGRATRIFPPHIRKALTARDQGCAFPNCTIPAPWCEAHHTTYWSHGGPTNTDNGVLLCTHHHHLIHKEHWQIQVRRGVPWFIPPPHIDPHQKPRRNHHHRT
ncbi:DUF222 domain-containing protein [Arthrobacter sp. NPDC093139]|uniref:HNH endonuclease signature motif containing protein n=1 Tax=Arthrobacter sp. NPDC093139 TaxID=3363945 RepID=UPI00382CA89C